MRKKALVANRQNIMHPQVTAREVSVISVGTATHAFHERHGSLKRGKEPATRTQAAQSRGQSLFQVAVDSSPFGKALLVPGAIVAPTGVDTRRTYPAHASQAPKVVDREQK